MLKRLVIRNYAVVEALDLEFGPGFLAATGETGAGKSIVVDALGLALGERARADSVRRGADSAEVSAVFTVGEGELLLRREVGADGRGRAWIDGAAATVVMLQERGRTLVDIHGQHEHQTLLRGEAQRDALDRYGDVWPLREETRTAWRAAADLARQVEDLALSERERAQKLDLYKFQMQEIEQAGVTAPDEDDALEATLRRLQHAEKLQTLAGGLAENLLDADGAAIPRLRGALRDLETMAKVEPEADFWLKAIEQLVYQLEDVAGGIARYRDGMEHSPAELEEAHERHDRLNRLKKKYGPTLREVLDYRDRARREVETLEHADERRAHVGLEATAARGRYDGIAARLRASREKAAGRLAKAVASELKDLGMARANLDIAVRPGEPGPEGTDVVEFQLAPNPGEGIRPLARIASGGELARVMLALKTVLAGADDVPTLIFDEVDAGIGGSMGTVIGRKLHGLGRRCQVISITHLPQVASFADGHLRVEKVTAGGRTRVGARWLDRAERVAELARMLGGGAQGKVKGAAGTAHDHAETLLKEAAHH